MSDPSTRRARLVAAVAVVVCVAIPALAGAVAADGHHGGVDDAVVYHPPVEAPVRDPFRPPGHAYGPGNRGLTYDLASGTPVHAAAPGVVAFAGSIGDDHYLSIDHADGRRSTYSYLSSVAVSRGQVVAGGTAVGTAGAGFHFGVREGEAYLDPADLFATPAVRVYLVAAGFPPSPPRA